MTFALETEVVASRYDPQSRTCFYTIERGGKRWTVAVHEDRFHEAAKAAPLALKKQKRSEVLAQHLQDAMRGPPDEE